MRACCNVMNASRDCLLHRIPASRNEIVDSLEWQRQTWCNDSVAFYAALRVAWKSPLKPHHTADLWDLGL